MTDEPRPAATDDPDLVELPMVCDCSEEGRSAAEALMAEVYARLARGMEESSPGAVTAENFLTAVARSLWWDMDPGVTIEGIYADQWFGVKAGEDLTSRQVFVACDRVEHGLAAVWKHYADQRDARRGTPDAPGPRGETSG